MSLTCGSLSGKPTTSLQWASNGSQNEATRQNYRMFTSPLELFYVAFIRKNSQLERDVS